MIRRGMNGSHGKDDQREPLRRAAPENAERRPPDGAGRRGASRAAPSWNELTKASAPFEYKRKAAAEVRHVRLDDATAPRVRERETQSKRAADRRSEQNARQARQTIRGDLKPRDREPARENALTPQKPPKVKLFVFGQHLSFDYGVLLCTIVLTILGLLMVLSAGSYKEGITNDGDALAEFRQQVVGAVLGFAAMLFVMNLDYRILRNKGIVITSVVVTLGLLAAVILLPYVVSGPPIWSPYVNYSHRWLRIGVSASASLSIQPSEIAKITMVLFLAWFFDKQHKRMKDLVHTVLPALLVAGAYAGLIILQPNLSTTGAILMVVLVMMYIAGTKWWVNVGLIGCGTVLIVVLLNLMPSRMVRYTSFVDPWADLKNTGWQLVQSYYALANGGWFGTGIGMSRQKHLFLPYSSSDFIFAIVGEELGFIGATLILLGFLLLVFFGIRVAMNAYDRFGCYLATGITAMLAIQVVINIAVVTGSMPTTGLPLPFFTAGGTTLIIFLCSMGLLLSVSRRQDPLAPRRMGFAGKKGRESP